MKVTQEQLVEMLADTNRTRGCCGECLEGQLGYLNRPYGQGHSMCSPLAGDILELCRQGRLTTEFNGQWKIIITTPKPCICDYPDGATVAQHEAAEGHYNQAGGYCCPHHGNTCGHCHEHDNRQ